jgi:hypothetical protein
VPGAESAEAANLDLIRRPQGFYDTLQNRFNDWSEANIKISITKPEIRSKGLIDLLVRDFEGWFGAERIR